MTDTPPRAPAAMTAARAAALLGALADLSEQQACALEGDLAPAVSALSEQMRDALVELRAADPQLLHEYVTGDALCRREVTRLASSHAQSRLLLPLALERVAHRRSHLARAGVEWYGGKPVRRSPRGDLDVSA
ncbi:MAG: hypothetical protein ACYC5O_02815 [Anaerolineae bacterium]